MHYTTRIKRQLLAAEPKSEYELQKRLSKYVSMYYPQIEYRVDLAGSNLSKAQSGKIKAVNKRKGWHDFEVYDPSWMFYGLCIELKTLGTNLVLSRDSKTKKVISTRKVRGIGNVQVRENFIRKKGDWKDAHIEEQFENCKKLVERGRLAAFGVGLENCLKIFEGYMNEDIELLKSAIPERCFQLLEKEHLLNVVG